MNIKYILIIVILVAVVGGGILGWQWWAWKIAPDKHCEQVDDCVATCGCGCINKNSTCKPPFGMRISCEYFECDCVNNQCVEKQIETPIDETADWQTYRDEEYGFEITLLNSWKEYLVLVESWRGRTLDGQDKEFEGPQIVIRHPEWTVSQPWQDIPIMVFTNLEWELVEEGNLNVSAAPIGPTKLDKNQNYVFALPPRWVGFTDNLGQNEATEIVETFKAF